ncbi:MAG: dienelactone hydrolase family protein, partial [Nannocystaceae bacterium]|nr:dienelactone hydrolase family protein [Nannocystaceae bacterium]
RQMCIRDRRYVERILGDAKPHDTLPMIIAIHGLGDDPDNFAHLFDAYGGTARLILPQGVDATPEGGWSWFPIRARSKDVDALASGIKASADKLAVAIAALRKSRPTQGDPIVTGFSQGGMLAFALAVHHPNQVGFSIPVGGWLPPPLWPSAGPTAEHPEVVALHGTADNAVPYEPTKEAIDALVAKGYTVTLKSYEGVRHAIPPQEQTDLYDLLDDALATARGQTQEIAQ